MELLFLDCCIREEESRTWELCQAFLKALDSAFQVTRLPIQAMGLMPFDRKTLRNRDALLEQGKLEDPWFDLAHQFQRADALLVGAPFWDQSFPAALKAYFERISVFGITFAAHENQLHGLCRARQAVYLSTAGYCVGNDHLGAQYTKAFFEMLGIHCFHSLCVGGLDLDGADQDRLMEEGRSKAIKLAEEMRVNQ